MSSITNGNWALEEYIVEEENGKTLCRDRLLHDGKVIVDPVLDVCDLFSLFSLSVVQAGFASLAKCYHERVLYEDDGELEFTGPSNCPMAGNEVLAHCRGDFASLTMPDNVCADLELPDGSTYGQGVEQFFKGYQEHATTRRRNK